MANYENLISTIEGYIKQNGTQDITGDVLQQNLVAMIESLGAGYQCLGIATPATSFGTPDQNVFYLASEGDYSSTLPGIVVAPGEIAILKYNGSWSKQSLSGFRITRDGGGIIQMYDGENPVYPRTKSQAVFFDNDTTKTLDRVYGEIYGDTFDETIADSVENGRYVRYTWTASTNYRSYYFERNDIKRVRCSLYAGGTTDVAISAYTSKTVLNSSTCLLQVFATATGSGNAASYDILIPEGAVLVVISNRSQYGTPTIALDTRGDLPVAPESIKTNNPLPIVENGYIKTDGSIQSASGYGVTDLIPVNALDKFIVSSYLSNSYVMMFGYFDGNANSGVPLYKGEGEQVIGKAMYVFDSRVHYVRICSRTSTGDVASFIQVTEGSVEEIVDGLNKQSKVSSNIPFLAKAKRLNSDGTTSDNTAYNTTEFIPVHEGDMLLYSGFLGSTATAMCGYSGNTEADFESVLIPTRGTITDKRVVVPTGITHIRACSRINYGDVYSLAITTQSFGEILTAAMPTIENIELEMKKFVGKRIAVLGDSIATGSNLNPYIRVQANDVGNTIQSYITYFDVYTLSGAAVNKTIGNVAITESMIGTLQSFTPIADDIGKTIGDAVSYYNGELSWPYFVRDYLGATLINASWSGASLCSGQSQQVRTLSYGWSDLSIRRCATRDENGVIVPPDIIIICRGVNDFSHEQGSDYAILENYDIMANGYPTSDTLPDNKYSFTRAYLLTIKKLRDAYPNAVIYCATLNVFKRVTYDRFPTRNGLYSLPQMNDKIRQIADEMGCNVIDFAKDGITFENCYPTYISDSAETPTHPNLNGQKVMAAKALSDLIFN